MAKLLTKCTPDEVTGHLHKFLKKKGQSTFEYFQDGFQIIDRKNTHQAVLCKLPIHVNLLELFEKAQAFQKKHLDTLFLKTSPLQKQIYNVVIPHNAKSVGILKNIDGVKDSLERQLTDQGYPHIQLDLIWNYTSLDTKKMVYNLILEGPQTDRISSDLLQTIWRETTKIDIVSLDTMDAPLDNQNRQTRVFLDYLAYLRDTLENKIHTEQSSLNALYFKEAVQQSQLETSKIHLQQLQKKLKKEDPPSPALQDQHAASVFTHIHNVSKQIVLDNSKDREVLGYTGDPGKAMAGTLDGKAVLITDVQEDPNHASYSLQLAAMGDDHKIHTHRANTRDSAFVLQPPVVNHIVELKKGSWDFSVSLEKHYRVLGRILEKFNCLRTEEKHDYSRLEEAIGVVFLHSPDSSKSSTPSRRELLQVFGLDFLEQRGPCLGSQDRLVPHLGRDDLRARPYFIQVPVNPDA